MSIAFAPARRVNVSTLTALSGASGSGKTMSALRLATGLAAPHGHIAMIDTERGRALHYAGQFKFDHGEILPPFRPAAYLEAVRDAMRAGYSVIVIDSLSHEWEGEGGCIEWADELAAKHKPPSNWIDPKAHHKRMVNGMLQCPAHLIFCLRAQEKIKVELIDDDRRPGQKRAVIVPIGWSPICEKRFMFEMTISMLMIPENPGVPVPIKIQDQHKHCFPVGEVVAEQSGRLLAEWAKGGQGSPMPAAGSASAPPVDLAALIEEGNYAADFGTVALQAFGKRLTKAERAAIGAERIAAWKVNAAASDKAAEAADVAAE